MLKLSRGQTLCGALLVTTGVLAAAPAFAAAATPVPVSPGAAQGAGIAIADTCPTFSWGYLGIADAYELTVYLVRDDGGEAGRVFTHEIPGSASAWTPSVSRCLEVGASYAWSVRAVRGEDASEWSEPSLFRVVAQPERERPVDQQGFSALAADETTAGASAADGETTDEEAASAGPVTAGPTSAAPPGTALEVVGNIDATSFSGDGSMLTNVDADTVDGFDAASTATANTLLALDGNGKLPADITGNAATATAAASAGSAAVAAISNALAADGANCPAGEAAAGIDALGNAQECRDQSDLTAFAVENTRVGLDALVNNTTGSKNTALGFQSLQDNTAGYSNTGLGIGALRSTTTGFSNTAVGAAGLVFNTTGDSNTTVGLYSLPNNTTGSRNTAIGWEAGLNATTGSDNIFVGVGADGLTGEANTIRIGGTTVGTGERQQNRTFINGIRDVGVVGGQTVVIDPAGQLGSTPGGIGSGLDADTVDGFDASPTPMANTLLALDGAGKLPADITGNAASATLAMAATALAADGLDCAADEAAAGVDAMGNAQQCRDQADLTAFDVNNTRVGSSALSSNTTGSENTAAGWEALMNNTTGFLNTAVGGQSLHDNTTGTYNTATGFRSLEANTTGYRNSGHGESSLEFNTTGVRNSAVGSEALRNSTSGSRNTAVGNRAGFNATTGSDNIFIGYGAEGVAAEANTIRIGGTTVGTGAGEQNKTFINGIRGVPVAAGETVVIDAAGQLGSTAGGTGSGLNADKVDGFDASATATANTLLALDGTGKLPADITGNAATATTATSASTATALAADGTDCAADEAAGGVDAMGNSELCRDQADLTAFGMDNTRVGFEALEANTTGSRNTAAGNNALRYNTTGLGNTAAGWWALRSNTTAQANTAFGSQALVANTTGGNNTAVGYGPLKYNTTGATNTAVGRQTLRANTTGSVNAGFGSSALLRNTTGLQNTAIGGGTLIFNTTGSRNTAVGYQAGQFATTGSDNIFIGYGAEGVAAETNTIRIGGTTVGAGAGQQNRTFVNGIRGVAVAGGQTVVIDAAGQLGSVAGGTGSGVDADKVDGFDASATATANTLLALDGTGKLPADITGNAATATSATSATTAATATALAADGTDCAADEAAGGVDASGNAEECRDQADLTAFGALNTRAGSGALAANTTGASNTATGYLALNANTTGFANTAIGDQALLANIGGHSNTAGGRLAMKSNTSGFANTATGLASLYANTTGNSNTASGLASLRNNTTGFNNSAVGDGALFNNTTGNANTAIGFGAGKAVTTGSNNIFVGSSVYGTAADANLIRIGLPGVQMQTYVAGIRGVTTGVADAVTVMIDSSGQLGTVSSSRRYKEDVADMGEASQALLELRPVTFRYKKEYRDGTQPIQYGLIAEEVAEVFPDLVVYNEEGQPETVKYHLLSSLLLNEVKEQEREIELLKAARVAAVERQRRASERLEAEAARVAALERQVRELQGLEARLARLEAAVSPTEPRRAAGGSSPSREGPAPR